MDNKKRQELLTKEFVSIFQKAQEICEKCADAVDIPSDQTYSEDLRVYRARSRDLCSIIILARKDLNVVFTSEKEDINFQNHQGIKDFKKELDEIFDRYSVGVIEYQKTDVVSEHLSKYEKFEVELINALRGFFGRIEAIFTGQKFDADQPNLGETRFALRATGHSQFIPRPMKSLNDAKEALDDISTKLNKCIAKNEDDDDFKAYVERRARGGKPFE